MSAKSFTIGNYTITYAAISHIVWGYDEHRNLEVQFVMIPGSIIRLTFGSVTSGLERMIEVLVRNSLLPSSGLPDAVDEFLNRI